MLGILIALGFSIYINVYNSKQASELTTIKRDYNEHHNSFEKIAQYLSDYDYPIIYAKKENIISDNSPQTINSIVSAELFSRPYTVCVEKLGYYEFVKDGGIYFIKKVNLFGEFGIMFYPSGFIEEYDGLVTTFEELSDGWYSYQKK